jgi:hypothetical protein
MSGQMRHLTGLESIAEIREAFRNNSFLMLSATALCTLLSKFVAGDVSTATIVELTGEFEHERVIYESGKEKLIAEILFEVSTPEINGELSANRSKELVEKLRTA